MRGFALWLSTCSLIIAWCDLSRNGLDQKLEKKSKDIQIFLLAIQTYMLAYTFCMYRTSRNNSSKNKTLYQVSYLCVLLERKNPRSFNACNLMSWLEETRSLNIHLTPCLASKAGTIAAGNSHMREIKVWTTSCRFSSSRTVNKRETIVSGGMVQVSKLARQVMKALNSWSHLYKYNVSLFFKEIFQSLL